MPPRLTARLFLRIDPLTLDRLNALSATEGSTASQTVRDLVTLAFDDAFARHLALSMANKLSADHDSSTCAICKTRPHNPRLLP